MGTELAIYAVKQMVHYYVRHNKPVYACYLDASKAFDLVNHFTLLRKLCDRGVPSVIVSLFLYWFRTQRFVVRWGETLSSSFPVLTSVRQGGVCSAPFFALYLNDLSVQLTASGIGCRIGSTVFNHAIYADDVCLMTTSIHALKLLLQICENYATNHDLKFNPTKSVCQLFGDSSYEFSRPLIKLCGRVLQWSETVRYLGFDINCNNRDHEEMLRRRRELYITANLIRSRFHHCSRDVKVYLFRKYFSTIYCNSLWCPVSPCVMDKLRVCYNDCFKIIMQIGRRKSSTLVFSEHRVRDFSAMRRISSYSLLSRLATTSNVIISAIVNSNIFKESSISKMWRSILFLDCE